MCTKENCSNNKRNTNNCDGDTKLGPHNKYTIYCIEGYMHLPSMCDSYLGALCT